MSGAERRPGPELFERVEQELDQALDTAWSTRDLRRLAMLSRAGSGWCSLISTVAGRWAATEARLRHGYEPEWESEPLDVENAISRYLT